MSVSVFFHFYNNDFVNFLFFNLNFYKLVDRYSVLWEQLNWKSPFSDGAEKLFEE